MKMNRIFASLMPFFLTANPDAQMQPLPMTNFGGSRINQGNYLKSNGKSKKHKTNRLEVSRKTKLRAKRNNN
jgi:hypothetical protein